MSTKKSIVLLLLAGLCAARAEEVYFVTLNGASQVPSNTSTGTGSGLLVLNPNQTLKYSFGYTGLVNSFAVAHVHGPAGSGTNAPVIFPLNNVPTTAGSGTLVGTQSALDSNTVSQLRSRLLYVNVHSFPGFLSGEIRGQVEPSGLRAWWRAEDNALDSAGTNHGTLQNGMTFGAGKAGRAFLLDGNNDFMEAPHSPSLIPQSGVSIEAWVNTTSSPDFAGIVSKMEHIPPIRTGFKMGFDGNGRVRADFAKGPGFPDDYINATNGTLVRDGQWHHLVATYDGTNALLYVDGVAGPPVFGTGYLTSSPRTLIVGNDDCCGGRYFQGSIDEVSLYSRALSATEVQVLFATGAAGKCMCPLLTVSYTITNTAVVSWPSSAAGFNLQQATNLTAPSWVTPPESLNNNGTDRYIIVNPPSGNRFYRLVKP